MYLSLISKLTRARGILSGRAWAWALGPPGCGGHVLSSCTLDTFLERSGGR